MLRTDEKLDVSVLPLNVAWREVVEELCRFAEIGSLHLTADFIDLVSFDDVLLSLRVDQRDEVQIGVLCCASTSYRDEVECNSKTFQLMSQHKAFRDE